MRAPLYLLAGLGAVADVLTGGTELALWAGLGLESAETAEREEEDSEENENMDCLALELEL